MPSGPRGTGSNTVDQDQAKKVGFLERSVVNGLTALAGGAQAGTSLANFQVNRFTTVASGNDSAQLPPAKQGMERVVINAAAANSMNVFPATGEFIDAGAANAAVAVAANKTRIFFCAVDGTWNSVLTA